MSRPIIICAVFFMNFEYMKKVFTKIMANKYLLVAVALLLQLAIFENINLFTLIKLKKQESHLKQQVQTQQKEIQRIKKNSETLIDPAERERFAREVYHFKKPEEEIFIISNN